MLPLERVFDEWDEGRSDDGWRARRGRIFWDGCGSLGVGPVLPSPIKMGFGVENRENSGETITESMLCKPLGCQGGAKGRNLEVTHGKHAQRASQESNTCNQDTFEADFEHWRHCAVAVGA